MKKIPGKYIFLSIVVVMYIVAALLNMELVKTSLVDFVEILKRVVLILGFVIIIMTLINMFLSSGITKKYLGESSGIKARGFAIVAGIFIGGPPYVLYPMLGELRKQGMTNALSAVFLYNRNVKIPFIPISIAYFGLAFTVVLSLYIMLFSILNGFIIGRICKD